jgi:hypothetical protein
MPVAKRAATWAERTLPTGSVKAREIARSPGGDTPVTASAARHPPSPVSVPRRCEVGCPQPILDEAHVQLI